MFKFLTQLLMYRDLHVYCSFFLLKDYPEISRPVVRPVIKRGRGCAKIALRCYFTIRGRKRRGTLSRVEWIINGRTTKIQTVRGSQAEVMENTYGFKAGTTVCSLPDPMFN